MRLAQISTLCSAVLILASGVQPSHSEDAHKPRVLVITDACLSCGNANDSHSLVHLLWHSDEIEIAGLIPNDLQTWQEGSTGFEAVHRILDAYAADYDDPGATFSAGAFPDPEDLAASIPSDFDSAVRQIHQEAQREAAGPLYILNWSNMRTIRAALENNPPAFENVRLITVATRTNYENCREPNLNGWGRDAVYRDDRFKKLWWLEMDWTQEAFVKGEEPIHLLNVLERFGRLGALTAEDAREAGPGTGYRASDAVSLIYLLDPTHFPADPSVPNWVGRFVQPNPQDRPHFYTDDMGPYDWDYEKPCRTWIDRKPAIEHSQRILSSRREEIYASLLARVNSIYPAQTGARASAFYEAETAQLSPDLEVKNDLTASHGFYVSMKGSGEIVWKIEDVPSEGDYILRIRYRLPYLHKTQILRINGEDRGEIKFDGTPRVWQEKEIIQRLQEGRNEIAIEKDWGYVDFDYLAIATEAT